MAQSDPVPGGEGFDISNHDRGTAVYLDSEWGPSCENCGWDEGVGFVVQGRVDPQTWNAPLTVACYVCYHSTSWNAFTSSQSHMRPASQSFVGRLMAEHTNLILKAIRDSRSE